MLDAIEKKKNKRYLKRSKICKQQITRFRKKDCKYQLEHPHLVSTVNDIKTNRRKYLKTSN